MRPLTKPFIAVAVFSPLMVLLLGACSGESNDSTTSGNDVAVAYVISFLVMVAVVGWHPNAPHKAGAEPAAVVQPAPVAAPAQ